MDDVKVQVQLGSVAEVECFSALLEFARTGRVITGWESEADGDPGEETVDVPVYDDSDRSGDPLYPLAFALQLCAWYDLFPGDEHALVVACMYEQPGTLDDALAAAPVPARRL